jgi:hypothetical protein
VIEAEAGAPAHAAHVSSFWRERASVLFLAARSRIEPDPAQRNSGG